MNFFEVIFGDNRWLYLWHGLEVTLVLTVLSLGIGTVIGVIIALMRTSTFMPLRRLRHTRLDRLHSWNPLATIAKLYVDIIRGTPLLVQLLIMYYVVFGSYTFMPKLFVAAIAFGINAGAYIGEIIRGGIESIDPGKWKPRARWALVAGRRCVLWCCRKPLKTRCQLLLVNLSPCSKRPRWLAGLA